LNIFRLGAEDIYLSEESRRTILGLLDLASFGVFALITLGFLFTHQEAYTEVIDTIINSMMGERIRIPNSMYDLAESAIIGLSIWFIILLAVGLVKKDWGLTLHEASLLILLSIIFVILSPFRQGQFTTNFTLMIILLSLALQQILSGIAGGLIVNNRFSKSMGDWKGIVRGIQVAILGITFMFPQIYTYLSKLTEEAFSMMNLEITSVSLYITLIPLVEVILIILLVTRLIGSFIFIKCPRCKSLILKWGRPVSGWDSEHTLRHMHCPRCKSTIDL